MVVVLALFGVSVTAATLPSVAFGLVLLLFLLHLTLSTPLLLLTFVRVLVLALPLPLRLITRRRCGVVATVVSVHFSPFLELVEMLNLFITPLLLRGTIDVTIQTLKEVRIRTVRVPHILSVVVLQVRL